MQAIADDLPVAPDQMVVFDSSGVIMATSPELGAAIEKVEGDPATDPEMVNVELDDRPRDDSPLVIPAEGEFNIGDFVAPPSSEGQLAPLAIACESESTGCMVNDLADELGNDPPFRGTGPYRRFWARPGISGFIGDIQLPTAQGNNIVLRKDADGNHKDLVFFYAGGRTSAALSANDAGLMYQPVNDNWAPLFVVAKAGGGQDRYRGKEATARFAPGQRVRINYTVGDNQLTLTLTGVTVQGKMTTLSMVWSGLTGRGFVANGQGVRVKRVSSIGQNDPNPDFFDKQGNLPVRFCNARWLNCYWTRREVRNGRPFWIGVPYSSSSVASIANYPSTHLSFRVVRSRYLNPQAAYPWSSEAVSISHREGQP